MPMKTSTQEKVLKIASNKAINNKVRLAVRKRFYELKNEEVIVEEVQDEFETKLTEFDEQLDGILGQINHIQSNTVIDVPSKDIVTNDSFMDEEIIVPPKKEKKVSGIQVRMQEDLEQNSDDDNDVEIPFEVDEQ